MSQISETQNNGLNAANSPKEKQETNILSTVMFCITVARKNWRWFALSALICVGLAYLYAKRKPRVYHQSATILLSGSDAKSNKSRAFNSLQEISGIQSTDNLKDEIFVLTSRRLMGVVVEQLKLDVSYSYTESLTPISLFDDTPIVAEFLENFKKAITFDAELKDNKILIKNTRVKGKKTNFEKTVTFNEPVKTPGGIVVFRKTKTTPDFNNKTIHISRISTDNAITRFRSCISANENEKDANLITLHSQDTNHKRANAILTILLEVYKTDIVDAKNSVANNTAKFIDERIELIGKQLSDVEKELVDFKQESNFLDYNLNVNNYLTESTTSHQNLLDLETKMAVITSLRDFIRTHAASEGKLIPVLGALGNESIDQQINDYNSLMVERNNLLINSSPTANAIVERDRVLSAMRSTICAAIDSYVSSISIQLNKARASDNALRAAMTTAPKSEIRTLDITRQQKIKEALYTYLLNKREETALQLAINEANVRVVEFPYGVNIPVSPHTSRILLIAFLIGIAIPAGIFWLLITMDKTVHGRKDIEDELSAPILGDIPRWNDDKNEKKFLSKEDNGKTISEAFRVLRYNLNMVMQEGVIVITSSTPSQGKSFISRNTAAILGIGGAKTLLIDADIRKNTVSQILNMRRASVGLTSYLAGQAEIDEIIQKDIAENLDMI
ncbi:MAG: GumC family protein, partial [Bacteroidaceae bacterium]